jgi:hypothetical protein
VAARLHGALRYHEVDHGPIVIQAAVRVQSADTAESLAARVLEQEHVTSAGGPLVSRRPAAAAKWRRHGKGNDAQLVLPAD